MNMLSQMNLKVILFTYVITQIALCINGFAIWIYVVLMMSLKMMMTVFSKIIMVFVVTMTVIIMVIIVLDDVGILKVNKELKKNPLLVIGLYSRQILNLRLSDSMSMDFCMECIEIAVKNYVVSLCCCKIFLMYLFERHCNEIFVVVWLLKNFSDFYHVAGV